MKLSKTITPEEEKEAVIRYAEYAEKIYKKSKFIIEQHENQKIKLNAKAFDDLLEIKTLAHLTKEELLWKWFGHSDL